ncbi:hypothetical protein CBR_g57874 [Chara braunii]|uniref:Uncharacterized protein n=1 Tax=Chara braunii TaxID=69332 RepID=A0A388K8E2_CHABU|nr:hypothetical protein CBR_g57874 [Chara braunii]|eukprot:GBG66276.1 hypothetical protein CBR_g57874 [Chara braunii]
MVGIGRAHTEMWLWLQGNAPWRHGNALYVEWLVVDGREGEGWFLCNCGVNGWGRKAPLHTELCLWLL